MSFIRLCVGDLQVSLCAKAATEKMKPHGNLVNVSIIQSIKRWTCVKREHLGQAESLFSLSFFSEQAAG